MKNADMPAMPPNAGWRDDGFTSRGLTKREYLAAMAMQAVEPPKHFIGEENTEKSHRGWAYRCARMADALLAELEKTR